MNIEFSIPSIPSNHHGSWWFHGSIAPFWTKTQVGWGGDAEAWAGEAPHRGGQPFVFEMTRTSSCFFIQKRWKQKTNMEHIGTSCFFSWEGFISNELFLLFLIGFRPQFVTQGCYRILRQEWLELLVTSWECSDFVGQGSIFFCQILIYVNLKFMFITLLHPMYVNHISPCLLVKRPFDIVVFQRHQQIRMALLRVKFVYCKRKEHARMPEQ